MINKTEQEVMSTWEQSDTPLVSITCVAFNHETYIEEAIDSFLMQETTFPFEILINDDVSSDRTIEILKTYEEKFPNIMRPIYQKVNQFSQGINTMSLLFQYVKGEYMAYCDGDDYWTDPKKLQIQVEAMQKQPQYDMSYHTVTTLINNVRCATHEQRKADCIVSTEEAILGNGDVAHNSSLLIRTRIFDKLPEWIYRAPFGDYPMQILGSFSGGILYIHRDMSIYRIGELNSWTNLSRTSNAQHKRVLFINKFLNSLNELTQKKYETEFHEIIRRNNFNFIKQLSFDLTQREEVFKLGEKLFTAKEISMWNIFYKNLMIKYAFPHQIKNYIRNVLQKSKVWWYSF